MSSTPAAILGSDRKAPLPRPRYGKIFAAIFAQRVLYSLALTSILLWVIFLLMEITGLLRNLFTFQYFGLLMLCTLAVIFLALMRIKLLTVKGSALNLEGMLFVLSSVIFSTISSFTYFRLYAPELVTILSYPEGKYGPPLLREQIVAVFSFAAILGFLGAAFISGLLAENDSNTYVSTLYINVEKVDVEARIRASINKSFSALPIVLTAVFIFYSFLMNVTGQLVLRTATFFISTVIPLRPTFHSFWNCFEFRLLYHFFWATFVVVFALEALNLSISLIFSKSFEVSKRTINLTSCLLDGLQVGDTEAIGEIQQRKKTQNPIISEQAAFELHEILWKDPSGRAKLFTDFVGNNSASKLICEWLVHEGTRLLSDIQNDVAILREIQDVFLKERMVGQTQKHKAETQEFPAEESKLFAPKKSEGFINGLVRRFGRSASLESVKQEPVPISSKPASSPIPDVLSLKSLKKAKSLISDDQSSSTVSFQKIPTWFSRNLQSILQYPLGSHLASLIIQYYRCRSFVDRYQQLIWLVESTQKLLVTSYDEDRHGQVQFQFDSLFSTLLQIPLLILELHSLPAYDTREYTLPNLTWMSNDNIFEVVIEKSYRAISQVQDRFIDCMDQLKLSKETRDRLERFNSTVKEQGLLEE